MIETIDDDVRQLNKRLCLDMYATDGVSLQRRRWANWCRWLLSR